MANTILITGATGKQGGAVIDALLASPASKDVTIFAVTRNPDSQSSLSLISKAPSQIKLVKGDMTDCSAIFATAATQINAVFAVSIPEMGFGAKPGGEEAKGKALIDAAVKHGVKHFVFTSVDRNGDTAGLDVPHFAAKANIEAHLFEKSKASDMTWTILRPVAFMDNFTTGFPGKIFPTAWKVGLTPTTKLQIIATVDIGFFGAQALIRPKGFAGRAISLAGDELTFDEANTIFREEIGYDIPTTYGFIASFLLWAIVDVGSMFKFFQDVGYAADIKELRKEHPGLLSLRDYLKTSIFVTQRSG